ncbi:hypothetical protein AW736_20155 [Termitidicoccus mucosus]|uniref:Uncharacterized protein n=1 Tax=Termitidicoccus mucosus TaxID=1184151 RepID=A0A178ICV3_9BACT|nr:hypothetical protein AW736_20155 [Opitutaceae bacterium TSB47]
MKPMNDTNFERNSLFNKTELLRGRHGLYATFSRDGLAGARPSNKRVIFIGKWYDIFNRNPRRAPANIVDRATPSEIVSGHY